jgi:hypothetical protein
MTAKEVIVTTRRNGNLVSDIISYEEGELGFSDTVQLFGDLVAGGMAWTLQGHYGRQAERLIEDGYIDREGSVNWERVQETCCGRCSTP